MLASNGALPPIAALTIMLGANIGTTLIALLSSLNHATPVGKRLALVRDLLSDDYRRAIGRITGRDLSSTVMEVNLIHYGPGAFMGPHRDLAEKLVTHVLYFNEAWNPDDGGCLEVLNSSNPSDVAATILPVVGNSALVVRSDQSWHSVSCVTKSCRTSRRSINVIFHLPGSVSTMWPPGENPALRDYAPDP